MSRSASAVRFSMEADHSSGQHGKAEAAAEGLDRCARLSIAAAC